MANNSTLSTSDFLKTMHRTPFGANTSLTLGEASLLSNVGVDANFSAPNGDVERIINEEKQSRSFWDNLFGTIDNIANSFGKGFVGMFEGIIDFGATIVGNTIDLFGGDSTGVQQFIEVDMSQNLANFTETFANFTPWGLVKENINFWSTSGFGGDYWNDAVKAWSSLGLGLWNVTDQEFAEWQDKYSWGHDVLEQDTGWFGTVALGVAEGAGQLVAQYLTTMGIGAIAGAVGKAAGWTSQAVATATKAGALATIGVSASGHATEQELKQGANLQQASMYGLLSGITEAGTEMIGGVMADIDSGLVGKIMRKTKTGNKILNNFFGNIIMNGIAEGFEEVLSDVADPLWKKLTFDSQLDLGKEYTSKEFFTGLATSFTVGSLVGMLGSTKKAYQATNFKINGKKIGATGYQYFSEYDSLNTDFKERATLVYDAMSQIEESGFDFKENTDLRVAIDEALNSEQVDEKLKNKLKNAVDKANEVGNKLNKATVEFDNHMRELGITENDLLEHFGKDTRAEINALKNELGIEIVEGVEDVIRADGSVEVATETVTDETTGETQQTPMTVEQAEPVARMADAIVKDKEGLRNYALKFVTQELTDKWTEKARTSMLEGESANKFIRQNAANEVIKEITDGDKYYTTKEGMADLVSILESASTIEEAREMIAENYTAPTDNKVNTGNKELIKTKVDKIPGRTRWSTGIESIFNKLIDSQYALRNTLKQLGISESQAEKIIGDAVNSTSVGSNKALNGHYHIEDGRLIKDSVGMYSSNNEGIVNKIQQFAIDNKLKFDEVLGKVEKALVLEHSIERVKQGKMVFDKYVDNKWMNKSFMNKLKVQFNELYQMFSVSSTYSQIEFDTFLEQFESLNKEQQELVETIREHFSDLSEEETNRQIAQIKKEIPNYDEIKTEYRKYMKEILKQRVNSGMITQEMADMWEEMYPNYVPTYRVVVGSGANASYRSMLNTDLKIAKGSNLVIQDIFASSMRQSQFVEHFERMNNVLTQLYNAAKNFQQRTGMVHENIQILSEVDDVRGALNTEEIIELNRPQIEGSTVTVYVQGKVIQMQVSDTLLESLSKLDRGFKSEFSKIGVLRFAEKTAQTMRSLMTTANPFFSWWRNPLKDIQSAVIYTKNGTATLMRNWTRSFNTVFQEAIGREKSSKLSNLYQVYIAEGGQSANLIGMNIYEDISYNENSAKRNIRKFRESLANFNEVMENTTRFAEFVSTYERLSKQGGFSEKAMIQEALNDAREVTLNFARKGTWTQVLNKYIPFLTANIEGAARNIRAFISPRSSKELATVIVKMLILGIAPQIIQELIYSDDKDYQNLSDTMRSNYYLFKVGDEFIRLPKGFIQQAFSSAVTLASRGMHGEDINGDDVMDMLENQWNAIGVDVSGFFFQPIIDASNNKTWYGGEIVPQKFDNTRPSEQYDRNTSAISKFIGKITGWSPMKIDYVLDQMTGIIGDILIPITSENGSNPLKFLKDQFVTDSVYKNRSSREFHDYKVEMNYDKTDGDVRAAVVSSYLNRISNAISELKDKQVELETANISETEKSAQDRIIQATINTTYQVAIENAKKIYKELDHYELSEESIKQDTIEVYRQICGAEFALKTFSSRVYSKAQCYYKAGVSYDNFYVYYFNMKSLPDKQSVENYIVRLRVSPQIKNMLFALMGYNIGKDKVNVLKSWLKRKGLTEEEIDILL